MKIRLRMKNILYTAVKTLIGMKIFVCVSKTFYTLL